MKKLAAMECGKAWDVNWRDTNHFFYNGLHMVRPAAGGCEGLGSGGCGASDL